MSAINITNRAQGPDRNRRYLTKVRLWVHSHNVNGVIDVSSSVVSFSTNKSSKSVGSMQFSLLADRNWLNSLMPNDYVNLYIDRGDGEGWTRTFFGFIDSVEESYGVDNNGIPSTMYSVNCSDFQKAFEKTNIYFNPHVAGRGDFSGNFVGSPNIGGAALRTRGVITNGSPADLMLNSVLLLLGFGTQFVLPSCYNPRLASNLRSRRAEFILGRLSEDARRQVLEFGGYQEFIDNLRNELDITTDTNAVDFDSAEPNDVQAAERIRLRDEATRVLGGNANNEAGLEAFGALNTTLESDFQTLLDVVDLFTFVERKAIDGYYQGLSVWDNSGSLSNFMNFCSNEIVNEIIIDLRAVSRNGGLSEGTDFSRELDDTGGNAGSSNVANGIQYVPAVVMREYPFSTIEKIDGNNIELTLTSPGAGRETLGTVQFGAIFSNQPNQAGRHIVTVPNMNLDDLSRGDTSPGVKHLDVAVVYDTEIKSHKLARSDNDHFNLFELYSDGPLGESIKYISQDLSPIITPIHVIRHGLRVRSMTTRFARFGPEVTIRVSEPSPEPTPVEETPPPEVAANPSVRPVELITSGDRFTQGFVSQGNTWHYRRRESRGTASTAFNGSTANIAPAGDAIWRFHNGIDVAGTVGTPVYAVRDGWVVAAAPAQEPSTIEVGGRTRTVRNGRGGFAGYGGTVIIYHDADSPPAADGTTADGAMFTLYAHLDTISSEFAPTTMSNLMKHFVSTELASNGTYTKQRVRAGQQIGTIGQTGSRDGSMGPHLHFEVITKRNGRAYPSMDRALTPDYLTNASMLQANGGWCPSGLVSVSEPSTPDESLTRSQNPLRVLESWGVTIPIGRDASEFSDDPPVETDGLPQVYTDDAGEFDADPETPAAASPTEEDTTPDSTVTNPLGYSDTPTTRRALARWTLLNDHWYQHNLEYLSGSIEMRGAPEIRVGYRLDLIDKNISAYVEGVSHNWTYGHQMMTTLHVTRGQANNPYPSYVLPYIEGFNPTSTQRQTGSRLGTYFVTKDPPAVKLGLRLERQRADSANVTATPVAARASAIVNETDTPAENGSLTEKYNEEILPAVTISIPSSTTQVLSLNNSPDVIAELFGGDSLDDL